MLSSKKMLVVTKKDKPARERNVSMGRHQSSGDAVARCVPCRVDRRTKQADDASCIMIMQETGHRRSLDTMAISPKSQEYISTRIVHDLVNRGAEMVVPSYASIRCEGQA